MVDGHLVDRQLGNYRLIRRLGEGGFGEVYLGEHIYLKTPAALKVLGERFSEHARARFVTEAQVVARLDHPHIVRVLEFGIEEQKDMPYLVMRYAAQGTIRRRYPTGQRVPLAAVVRGVREIAAALQYAHDRGVIHRDVKPENILVGAKGETLLSDFGLAIIVQNEAKPLPKLRAGTVLYMAPEQLEGRPGRASDQYALGVVAYEWLCGQPPFQGSEAEIAQQHLQSQPTPLHIHLPDIPLELENVILRALAKDPAARFPRVEDFAWTLEQVFRLFVSRRSSAHHPATSSSESFSDVFALFSDGATIPETPALSTPPLEPASTNNQEGQFVPLQSDEQPAPLQAALSDSQPHSEPDTSSYSLESHTSSPPRTPDISSRRILPEVTSTPLAIQGPSPLPTLPAVAAEAQGQRQTSQKTKPQRLLARQLSRRRMGGVLLGLAVLGGGSTWYITSFFSRQPAQSKTLQGPKTRQATANTTQTVSPQDTQTASPIGQSTPNPGGQPSPPAKTPTNATPSASTPAPVVQPTTAAPTPTPVALSVKIEAAQLPATVVYGSSYTVPVSSSEPNCSVVLSAYYATSSTQQNIGTQTTDSQGNTIFSWHVKSGLLTSNVTLTALATSATGRQATTQVTRQVAVL